MKYLPKLPYSTQQKHAQILAFRGINLTDNFTPGSAADSENISTRRYPYITTRNGRGVPSGGHNSFVTSLFAWDQLVKVVGTRIYIGDELVADPEYLVDSSPKQFAVVNTKLVIFPDKAYVDMSENPKRIRPLANSAKGTGGVVFNETDGQIAIPAVDEGDFSLFGANNALLVSGCSESGNNTYMRITGAETFGASSRNYSTAPTNGTRKEFHLLGRGAKDNFVLNVWLVDGDNNQTDA